MTRECLLFQCHYQARWVVVLICRKQIPFASKYANLMSRLCIEKFPRQWHCKFVEELLVVSVIAQTTENN